MLLRTALIFACLLAASLQAQAQAQAEAQAPSASVPPPAPPPAPPSARLSVERTLPGAHWASVDPHALTAACAGDLAAVERYVGTLDTTTLVAAQRGRLLFTHGPIAETSIVFSVRKSLLALLYGRHVASGRIDLDRTLESLGITDVGGLLPAERQATVRHLLASRSGVYHPAANGGDDSDGAPPRGSRAPGSTFVYNNWDFNVAGSVFEQLVGQGIYEAFRDDLARPLQLEDFDFARHRKSGDRSKSSHLSYPFFLSTRDMARIGQLVLEGGTWKGQVLVPEDWVAEVTRPGTPSAQMLPPRAAARGFSYGLMWWVLEEPADSPLAGGAMAWGVHGQYILVLPRHDMVIAHKRRVPDRGRWDVSWVGPRQFLHAATLLAQARCD